MPLFTNTRTLGMVKVENTLLIESLVKGYADQFGEGSIPHNLALRAQVKVRTFNRDINDLPTYDNRIECLYEALNEAMNWIERLDRL